jgi:hypothetical protein
VEIDMNVVDKFAAARFVCTGDIFYVSRNVGCPV